MHSSHSSVLASRPMAQDFDRPHTGASNSDVPEHSIHMRSRSTAHAQSPKRLSVFSGRTRSNTTASTAPSTTSSRRSPTSSMTSADAASLPSAHEDRTGSAGSLRHERQETSTKSKSIFLRGSRILRRQGSKFNIVATLDEEEEIERERSHSVFGRNHKTRSNGAHEQMKRMISEPFDFHHLTHTSPAQFHGLERTRQTDLVTEFSAIRASQKPVANLKGIQAEDLHSRNFSTEDLSRSVPEHDNTGPLPRSPPASPGGRSSASPRQRDYRTPRDSRVFENFSRPVSRYPRADSAASQTRPASPRLASSPEIPEPSPRVIDEILGFNSQPTYPEHLYSDDDDLIHASSLANPNVDGLFRSSFGHAITTSPDNEVGDVRAMSALTSPSSELEGVPEEVEATHWHDSPQSQPAEDVLTRGTDTQDSPSFQPMEAQSAEAPKSHMSVYVAKELSKKFSEVLGSPTLPQHCSDQETVPNDNRGAAATIRRQSSIHRRAIHETIYESWDDDIDYCYEHAAESNSNFDWTRTSLDEAEPKETDVTVTTSNLNESVQPTPQPNTISLRISTLSTPELDPSASRSVPSSRMATTPSTTGYEGEVVTQRDGDYFQPVSSSVFSGALGKHVSPDSLYEYLAGDAESDRHFSFCSQGGFPVIDHPVSPRSSSSPISKCNSEESLILSRAASIVRKHRSSVSTTSIPELVHSLASSRDFSSTDPVLPEEQAGMRARDSVSYHRPTRSLAREIEAQIMAGPDGSTEPTKQDSVPAIHDRAKSTSDVETAPVMSKTMKSDPPSKNAQRRKGRTSYSLFPTPAPANS